MSAGVLPADPFQTIDTVGVGSLVRRATEAGREANPSLGIGICGEHGGDPDSIDFFNSVVISADIEEDDERYRVTQYFDKPPRS